MIIWLSRIEVGLTEWLIAAQARWVVNLKEVSYAGIGCDDEDNGFMWHARGCVSQRRRWRRRNAMGRVGRSGQRAPRRYAPASFRTSKISYYIRNIPLTALTGRVRIC